MLHDCLMFGLNNSPAFEQKMASSYFLKAGSLYHPESMSFLAREKFFQLKTLMLDKGKSAKDLDMNFQEKLQEFLEWFKKLAYMGQISKNQVEFLKNTKNSMSTDLQKNRCIGFELKFNFQFKQQEKISC